MDKVIFSIVAQLVCSYHLESPLRHKIDLHLSGTIIRGTLKAPNSQLVTPISTKLQRLDGCDQVRDQSIRGTRSRLARA
jgi:hypothetical protein